jgi:hypothetical protein
MGPSALRHTLGGLVQAMCRPITPAPFPEPHSTHSKACLDDGDSPGGGADRATASKGTCATLCVAREAAACNRQAAFIGVACSHSATTDSRLVGIKGGLHA